MIVVVVFLGVSGRGASHDFSVEPGVAVCAQSLTLRGVLAPVAYDWVEFVVVREGGCVFRHREEPRAVRARPGDVLFVLSGVPYGVVPEGQVRLTRVFMSVEVLVMCVGFSQPRFDEAVWLAPALARGQFPQGSQLVRVEAGGLASLFGHLDGLAALTARRVLNEQWAVTAHCFFGVASWVSPKLVRSDGWCPEGRDVLEGKATQGSPLWVRPLSPAVRKARGLIEARFREAVTIEWLAGQVSMSVPGLRKRFTAELGKTPKAYLLGLRVQHMARLLLGSDLSVEEIARRSGWADRSGAVAVFAAAAQITPAQYRRRYRAGQHNVGDVSLPDVGDLIQFRG